MNVWNNKTCVMAVKLENNSCLVIHYYVIIVQLISDHYHYKLLKEVECIEEQTQTAQTLGESFPSICC